MSGTRFVYTDGNEEGDPFGRVVLTLDRDTRRADLEHSRGGVVRSWTASLPDDTWDNLMEILTQSEFPKPALEKLAAKVPGTVTTQFSLESAGKFESVSYRGDTDDYVAVGRVVWSIVAQMAPSLLGGPEDLPPLPRTRIENPQEVSPVREVTRRDDSTRSGLS